MTRILEIQMTIPGDGHEHVRNRQQRDSLRRMNSSFFSAMLEYCLLESSGGKANAPLPEGSSN